VTVYLDYETRCRANLKQVGAWRYVRDSSLKILIINYCIDDGPVISVFHDDARGCSLFANILRRAERVVAHNVTFDRLVSLRYGIETGAVWDCTMARARMAGLPPSLKGAAPALGLPVQKDKEGAVLIKLLCMPNAEGKFHEDPDALKRLAAYGAQDVVVCRALDLALPHFPPREAATFEYDFLLNWRGVRIDERLLDACQRVAAEANTRIDEELLDVSGVEITRSSQRNRILAYATDHLVITPDLSRRTIGRRLLEDQEMPGNVRRVLQLRSEGARTSTRKLAAIGMRQMSGWLPGMLQYYGAHTGRHSSVGVQLQNLPRPDRPWWQIAQGIEDLMQGDTERIRLLHGAPLALIADTLRSLIVPEPGCVFEVCDLNAVELRGAAWLAGEQYTLDALVEGVDLYCNTAAAVVGHKVTKADYRERFLGKTLELAGQYGMGWKRFQKTCGDQGVEVDDVLARRGVATYRSAHPHICQTWRDLEAAAKLALRKPGFTFPAGKLAFRLERGWLLMRLPSNRCLYYYQPRILVEEVERDDGSTYERDVLTFMGVNSLTRQWQRQRTWGAMLLEHATQAICRDILMDGCARLETSGHPVRLLVHDETVSEVPANRADIEHVEAMLAETPVWAPGLPLAAQGEVVERYRKI
jgi:DNA polymerase